MNYFLLAILLYILYLFIARFVIPIARTTNEARRRIREMQERQSQYSQQHNTYTDKTRDKYSSNSEDSYADKGEYIEFEEIKENK